MDYILGETIMAWEIISKSSVAGLIGVSESVLQDGWYDMAVALIQRRSKIHNIADPKTVTETHYIWDFPVVFVRQNPILAVSSVSVDGVELSADKYSYDSRQIFILDTTFNTNDKKTVLVSFSSGTDQTDYAVAACIALVIKEFANMRTMEGSETLIQFYRPGQSKATERPLVEWGIQGKINGIIDAFLGRKLSAI
jgi:hypothetical protein